LLDQEVKLPITTLPPKVRKALGITDPFGSQIGMYRAALKILQDEYGARLSYHGLQPNWVKVEEAARDARRRGRSLLALWRLKCRDIALEQIEQTRARRSAEEKQMTAAGDLAAQMLKALGG
jgi:hypothetical protein